MSPFQVRVGSRSAQGLRPNNEDRYLADTNRDVFLVADGMGGQEQGEIASSMAVEIIPRAVRVYLDSHVDPSQAVMQALLEANRAILDASRDQASGRRMGTTAVLAVRQNDQVYVAGFGDSRAYLIRGDSRRTAHHRSYRGRRLAPKRCLDARTGPAESVSSCALQISRLCRSLRFGRGAAVHSRTGRPPDSGQRRPDQLCHRRRPARGAVRHGDPQEWANELVTLALERGSNDNVTCVVVAFS